MVTKLVLHNRDPHLYLPERARISKIRSFTAKEKSFELELLERDSLVYAPGQFLQISILGIGEAPISISSAPNESNRVEISVRAIGDVTTKLHNLRVGDIIYVRGPFGNGFNQEILARLLHKHLLFIMGGIGFFPLRSLLNLVVPKREKYKRISILYGCKSPEERMYPDELAELAKLGGNVELLETVDHATAGWYGNCGPITTLLTKFNFDPRETIALIVGPPIMYKFVLPILLEQNLPPEQIYLDMERRMKCGVGKCGHCQMEEIYVCQEGPVVNYAAVATNAELL